MWRISTRLLALATVAAVLPAGMGTWSLWQHYQSDRSQAAEQVGLLAEALAGEGGRIMGSARQLIDVLATFPSVTSQDALHCSAILAGVHATVPQYAILAVANTSGTVFCASRPLPPGANAQRYPWFQRAVQSVDGFGVGDYMIGELTGKPELQFSRRITGVHGDAVLLAALELNSLSRAFADLQLPPDARINIIDRTGHILYRYPQPEEGIGKLYPDQDLLASASAKQFGIRNSTGLDGVERIVAFLPLSQIHDTGITITVGRASAKVLEPAHKALALNLAVMVLAVAVATGLAWVSTGHPIASNILRLVQVTRAIAGGRQDARVGPLATSSEINELAAAFDLMADTLAQRQAELESALERLETSTDLARIGIFDWDVASNTIVWNKQHFLLFGYDPDRDTASFDAFMARLHPDDAGLVMETLEQARASGCDYRTEYRLVLPPNEVRWVLGVGRYTYEAGAPSRMRGVVIDITDRRKAEDFLRRVQKMDALGQMTGGIAHDINNILGIISANLQLMDMRPTAENVAEGIKTSMAATDRGADLVRRLLAFSRRQSDFVSTCDVRHEVERVKPLLEKSLPKGVAIGVFIPDDLWPATMAAAEFGDALLNLAINSAHAMPRGGGRLHIEATNAVVEEGGLAAGPDLTPGEYVVIAVSDDGTGISPGIIEKVFEPFFSTKERTQGSGLGLSMVYGFAKRCGGSARIYSEVGRGTTVRLYLPRGATAARLASPPVRPKVTPGGGETVLIVDDEAGFLRVAEAYLRDLGYRTLIAERPAEALTLLGEVGRIDLLFSDVVMPGPMTGVDLADRMSALQPDVKVLLTTGFAESSPSREDNPHAYPILAKPYRLDELGARVRSLLDNQSA